MYQGGLPPHDLHHEPFHLPATKRLTPHDPSGGVAMRLRFVALGAVLLLPAGPALARGWMPGSKFSEALRPRL